MRLEDFLEKSKLSEAKKSHESKGVLEAFGIGYWVDSSGELHNLGKGKTHEEWANERNSTVAELIDRGWTRIRNFGSSAMNYVQGDSNRFDNIWYVIDVAEQANKNHIIYHVGRQRIELVRKDGKWVTPDGTELGEITESKHRIVSEITP